MSRRIAGALAVGAVAATLLATPAGAAPPEDLDSYAAGGRATALLLEAPLIDPGLVLTANDINAQVNSEPKALADGLSLVIPQVFSTDSAPSLTPGGETSNSACALDEALPEPINALGLQIACLETAATVTDGAPAATATGGEITLEITGPDLIADGGELDPVIDGVSDGLDQLLTGLEPLTAPLAEAGVDIPAIVDSIITHISEGGVLARITVAPTATSAGADAAQGVLARSAANGATIEVLPELPLDIEIDPDLVAEKPLVTVVVGQSLAEVVRDPATGAATTNINPAPVDIVFGDALPLLNEITQPVEDALMQLAASNPLQCAGDNPLADIICIDAASEETFDAERAAELGFDYGADTVGGRATALGVELLPVANDGNPSVRLALAEAIVAANAAVQLPRPAAPPAPPDQERSLPRTGGGAALPIAGIGGLAGLALLGLVVTRRAAAS